MGSGIYIEIITCHMARLIKRQHSLKVMMLVYEGFFNINALSFEFYVILVLRQVVSW
jgi:hypothetical protein